MSERKSLWVQRGLRQVTKPRWTTLIHHATEQSRHYADEGVLTDCGRYMLGRNSKGDLILSDEQPKTSLLAFCEKCLEVESAT